MVVAQLAEWSHPIPKVRGSTPVITKFYYEPISLLDPIDIYYPNYTVLTFYILYYSLYFKNYFSRLTGSKNVMLLLILSV